MYIEKITTHFDLQKNIFIVKKTLLTKNNHGSYSDNYGKVYSNYMIHNSVEEAIKSLKNSNYEVLGDD